MEHKKAFISYSWTNEKHIEWVKDLATRLRESGVDVTLDKWDLKEGHDAHVFMEQMVSDENMDKVIIVCDKAYTEKSNNRTGGAGTEAQIISAEIYEKTNQDKFALLVREVDENGNPILPVYYKSKVYIDFSNNEDYSEKFDQLLRWIHGIPLNKKPKLGTIPTYLTNEKDSITLSTSTKQKEALNAIKNQSSNALSKTKDYFECFLSEVENFRFEENFDPLSDKVITNLESSIPYRNELIKVFKEIARNTDNDNFIEEIHSFFEGLLDYYFPTETMNSYNNLQFDNFKFMGHEFFLHAQATFIKEKRYDIFNHLIENRYFNNKQHSNDKDTLLYFSNFRVYLNLFEHRNNKLKLQRTSIPADMLKDRCSSAAITFKNIQEVDFILWFRAHIQGNNIRHEDRWWPETLIYLGRFHEPFEIFTRSRQEKHFNKVKSILGVNQKEQFISHINNLSKNENLLPSYNSPFSRIRPNILTDIEKICSI